MVAGWIGEVLVNSPVSHRLTLFYWVQRGPSRLVWSSARHCRGEDGGHPIRHWPRELLAECQAASTNAPSYVQRRAASLSEQLTSSQLLL